MKKIIKIISLTLVFVLALSFAAACKDGEKASFKTFKNDSAEFTYAKNTDKSGCIIYGVKNIYKEDIVIPEKIDDLPVVEIAKDCFKDEKSIKSIKISASVIRIGENAFSGCTALAKIYFSGTKSQWSAVSKGASWSSNTASLKVTCSDGEYEEISSELGTTSLPNSDWS